MNDVTVKSIEQITPYTGPHAIEGIRFRAARPALGVTAWGMNVLELDPRTSGYPDHDHVNDGQEEVYVLLSGAAVLEVGGETLDLVAGQMVRVPPALKRKFVTHEQGATILAIGGTPGKAYQP